jgi:hypothetical protein
LEEGEPSADSEVGKRFPGDAAIIQGSETWTPDAHPETSVEWSVRRTLHRNYLIVWVVWIACCVLLIVVGWSLYHSATYVDPLTPDHSALDIESDTYWTDRILIDIETALQSEGSEQVRLRRLRTFAYRTVAEAMNIPTPYAKAQAVTSVAVVLTQRDIDIVLDSQLQQLGNTSLIAAMRARVLVFQALMYLRKEREAAARLALQRYRQLLGEADLKLNSSANEDAFFGAVTVLHYLGDREGLFELFEHQRGAAAVLGIDQQMRAYRMIAGEQARIGMITEAMETAQHISNPVESARAWGLILRYSARPPRMQPVEPALHVLLDDLSTEPLMNVDYAKRVTHDIFQSLANNKDINTQADLLQRIVGSRLMYDAELHKLFRDCLVASEVLQDRVKQQVLRLLDDPESPTIRAALNMPAASHTPLFDSALDDWSTSEEPVHVEAMDIDPTPLRARADQQWIQALLAVAQGYQSIRRFQDADRILKQAFVAAQRFTDTNIRTQLLMQIGERQVAIGSITDAKKTFAAAAPTLNQHQKEDLARHQILARLFDDAMGTISAIESATNREYAGIFLLQEQIRTNRLNDAEQTLALLPPGRGAAEGRSRLNIARGEASREDFRLFGLVMPEGSDQEERNHDWERHCIRLLQQGFLWRADQAANNIHNTQRRAEIKRRIAGEYLLLYQAFNDSNDPARTIRRDIQQAMIATANRTSQPILQTTLLTELLQHHTGRLQTEADREEGKHLWTQAMNACRNIAQPDDQAILFAQLIVAKNLLENPNLQQRTMPLFTRATNAPAFEETNSLVNECLALVNTQEDMEKRGIACAHLAQALAQVGRTTSAQILLNDILEHIVPNTANPETSVSILLSMLPALKAMNSADTISILYRLAIDAIAQEFSNRNSNVDVYDWRMRDSRIEHIVRSQLEHGFVDEAVESMRRLNEPVLHDRLLRTAAYIYLDLGNLQRAELEARRMTVREIRDTTLQNIQIIKRRFELPPPHHEGGNNKRPLSTHSIVSTQFFCHLSARGGYLSFSIPLQWKGTISIAARRSATYLFCCRLTQTASTSSSVLLQDQVLPSRDPKSQASPIRELHRRQCRHCRQCKQSHHQSKSSSRYR